MRALLRIVIFTILIIPYIVFVHSKNTLPFDILVFAILILALTRIIPDKNNSNENLNVLDAPDDSKE